jgi:ubiquinone/menaquinone biosynthesis C-methylase UbiE
MGFYSRVVFPWGYDFLMSSAVKDEARRTLLSGAKGEILEIGFGTGLNLPHYPSHVQKITTVDNNPGMNAKTVRRIQASPIAVDNRVLDGENLPMMNETFDTVVTTYTLCSIDNVDRALKEIYRVLKPGGRFLFLEHGSSQDPKVQKWQHRLTPFQKVLGVGCRLDRNMRRIIRDGGFGIVELQEYYMSDDPKTHGYTYQGIAEKPARQQER